MRAARHDCYGHEPCWKELTLAAGVLVDDAWFAFADGAIHSNDSGIDQIEATLSLIADDDEPVFHRAIACFGMPWAQLSDRVAAAMLRTLAAAPMWWADEFMFWEPDELRALRGNVTGGQESFMRAMRAIREYRLSVDRMPPLRGL